MGAPLRLPGAPPDAEAATAGYLTLVNRGSAADALVAATADVGRARRAPPDPRLSGLIRWNASATVGPGAGRPRGARPGSCHLMLIGLGETLTPGQAVTLTLQFRRAGRVTTRAEVR